MKTLTCIHLHLHTSRRCLGASTGAYEWGKLCHADLLSVWQRSSALTVSKALWSKALGIASCVEHKIKLIWHHDNGKDFYKWWRKCDWRCYKSRHNDFCCYDWQRFHRFQFQFISSWLELIQFVLDIYQAQYVSLFLEDSNSLLKYKHLNGGFSK